jgi:hypothetical protein
MGKQFLRLFLLILAGTASFGMIYRPADMHLWDTWCYYHEGSYFLYILKSDHWDMWDGFNVSTSKDGVHWEYQGRGIDKGEGANWLGTGSVWKSPNFEKDGRFICNFSEQTSPDPQHIYFGESRDLLSWKRMDVTFQQDSRWYEQDGRWDCIYSIPRPGGGYYGYWTATPKDIPGFGFGETEDGVQWRALPSPEMDWGDKQVPEKMELGAVEKIGDLHYAMVGYWGVMTTFIADQPQGPFRAAEKNFNLLRGDCYFARFFPTPDGLLISHHLQTRIVRSRDIWGQVNYIAPLKRALVDEQGTLRLGWWEGNDALKGEERSLLLNRSGSGGGSTPALIEGPLDIRRGAIVEGTLSFPADSNGAIPGVWVETVEGSCAAIRILSCSETLGGLTGRDGSRFTDDGMERLKGWQHVERDLPYKAQVPFRLLVRHSHIELYLDGFLFNVYSLPEPFTGRIGFMDNGAGVSELRAWTMTLPDELPPRTSYYPDQE